MFIKYHHVERLGNDEVEGVLDGRAFVFPKIDGTNASLWAEDGELKAGSRNRSLETGAKDNAGFYEWALQSPQLERFTEYFTQNPTLRLYGEWLVPHTLKAYRDEAWREFYVFDVGEDTDCETCEGKGLFTDEYVSNVKCRICNGAGTFTRLVSFEDYSPYLEELGITYIPPLRILREARESDVYDLLSQNFYLMPDGSESVGEGLVIKNYDYRNKYGRQTWGKVVRQEFKEQHVTNMGAPELGAYGIETIIIETLTKSMVGKVIAKIQLEEDTGWKSQYIPRLLGTVYHDFITEELWDLLKTYKQPRIDFKYLQRLTTQRIKMLYPEIFQ